MNATPPTHEESTHDERNVVLKRNKKTGFGVTILAEKDVPSALYIMSVRPAGPAAKSKKVFSGDRVTSINGHDTTAITQGERGCNGATRHRMLLYRFW